MSDEHLSTYQPPPPRQPQPGEHLYSVLKDNVVYRVEIRDDDARGLGTEFQILRDGELVYGRRLAARGLALAEAESLRAVLKAQGWIG
jgi:hypothetical protein